MDNKERSTETNNPFLGLFNSEQDQVDPDPPSPEDDPFTLLVYNVFGLTVDNGPTKPYGLVLLKDLASPGQLFTVDSLGTALFERLLLDEPNAHISKRGLCPPELHVIQTDMMFYLYECFKRIKQERMNVRLREKLLSYVIHNAGLALIQPSLFTKQEPHYQVVKLFGTEAGREYTLAEFLRKVADALVRNEGEDVLKTAFQPLLVRVHEDFKEANIIMFPRTHFLLLNVFTGHSDLAKVLVDYIVPRRPHIPLDYSDTLLGSMLNLSCLPKLSQGQYEYFDQQDYSALKAVEKSVWTGLGELAERIHGLLEILLRDTVQRKRVLAWIGGCLDANVPRGKLWASASYPLLPIGVGFVSDAFALNLAAVLLRLCRPFIDPKKSKERLLRIDPTYSAASGLEGTVCHMKSLASESCLQPLEEGQTRPVANTGMYSFISEIFHITHRAVDLSVRVLLDRVQSLYHDMARLQHITGSANTEAISSALSVHMPRFVSMRCALLEPSFLQLLSNFEVSTCSWVLQVLLDTEPFDSRESYAPFHERPIVFPLPEHGPPTLTCIPELMLDSVEVWLRLCKNYASEYLEDTKLGPVLSMLLVFMSSKHRARNPHLRAHLAQSLEALLPIQDSNEFDPIHTSSLSTFNRTMIFSQHPLAKQIAECLIKVFVSIEMTGESVAFEQKFNYRRPMYEVMEHLWTLEIHREAFRNLSRQAEKKMDETDPPLFLRFVNLLINDAIFLLDEALSNMAQLRTMLAAREAGEWDRISDAERRNNEQQFQQTGMTARYDNILGKETIHTIQYLSNDIRPILCHSTMVDRIASMLNYFLYHLVSPNKKNFKVKYQDEYKFEPSAIVKDICSIYVSLGGSDAFCMAVSRDGRSYSPQLFRYACDVLARIGGGRLIVEVEQVAKRVAERHIQLETEEELQADCPEEFLDPIMNTFMYDPVLLPSSKMSVDRSTIARHLLSDQSDPFNRAPLTMNMVESNIELKAKIEAWIAERKLTVAQEKEDALNKASEKGESSGIKKSHEKGESSNKELVSEKGESSKIKGVLERVKFTGKKGKAPKEEEKGKDKKS